LAELQFIKQLRQAKSEKDFLILKARFSKHAFANTLHSALSESLDLAKWTQKYPLQTTGMAAVVGFIGAQQLEKEKLGSSPQESERKQAESSENAPSLFEVILQTASELIKSVVTPWMLQQLKKEIEEHSPASDGSSAENNPRLH